MSAVLCDACHLTGLAAYAVRHGLFRGERNAVREAFDILARENHASVRTRYPHHPDPGVPEAPCSHAIGMRPEPIAVVKACDCYDHQACEGWHWEESPARELTRAIRHHAIESLPGYEQAEWGWQCEHGASERAG